MGGCGLGGWRKRYSGEIAGVVSDWGEVEIYEIDGVIST